MSWSGIEVVITGLTRNQFAFTGTWVRIPPAPPKKSDLLGGRFFRASNQKASRHARFYLLLNFGRFCQSSESLFSAA